MGMGEWSVGVKLTNRIEDDNKLKQQVGYRMTEGIKFINGDKPSHCF